MKRTVISNILVAVDGSRVSRKAAIYAVELAKGLNASVTFISVIDNTAYTGRTAIPAAFTPTHITEPVEDYLRRAAEVFTSRLEKACRERDVTARSVIRVGPPVEEILKEGRRSKADLIVAGSHGRSAAGAALLGSVAFGIVHRSQKTPVLIVR